MKVDMKIKMKLFLGFGTIMAICALVALTALYAISKLDANITNLVDSRIPQMKRVADINQAVSSSALHIEDAMIAADQNEAMAELASASVNQKVTAENFEKLKESLLSEKEKSLFQALMVKRTPYTTARNQVVAFLNEGKKEEALKTLRELRPIRTCLPGRLG